MVVIKKISEFLDKILKVDNLDDSSNNGLQVENISDIKKIAFAVDASLDVFEKAQNIGANLLIVHHGISWADSLKYITNRNYKKLNI